MSTASPSSIAVCRSLTDAISGTQTVEEIYTIALDALEEGLGVTRASVLLFDHDGVMRFKAFRGLSEPYRRAVEGHTPWRPDSPDPQPLVIGDVRTDPSLQAYVPIIQAEGIAAMAFIPLVSLGCVIGKFMLYYDAAPGSHTRRAGVGRADRLAGGVCRGQNTHGRAGASQRGTAALCPRCRVHGHLGLERRDPNAPMVRQPRAIARPAGRDF